MEQKKEAKKEKVVVAKFYISKPSLVKRREAMGYKVVKVMDDKNVLMKIEL